MSHAPGLAWLFKAAGGIAQQREVGDQMKKLEAADQERLINWGYAVCDAAVRRYFDPSQPAPDAFPYPRGVA